MKYTVIVTPKKTILDPQGKAIKGVAESYLGKKIDSIRVGKYFEIETEEPPDVVERLAKRILSNEVIEDYRVMKS